MNNKKFLNVPFDYNTDNSVASVQMVKNVASMIHYDVSRILYDRYFDDYYDLTKVEYFTFSTSSSGIVIDKFGSNLYYTTSRRLHLSDLNKQFGFKLGMNAKLILNQTYSVNNDFTLFFVFKRDKTSFSSQEYKMFFADKTNSIGMTNMFPKIKITPTRIKVEETLLLNFDIDIPTDYQNKQLCIWFTKIGNTYKFKMCNHNSNIQFTTSSSLFTKQPKSIMINLGSLYLARIGIKKAGYDFHSDAFKTVIAAEYLRGTYFNII